MSTEQQQSGNTTQQPAGQRTGSRLRRILRWPLRILAGLFLLVLVVLSLISAALGTVAGSSWALNQLTGLLNSDTQTFAFNSAEGTLLRGLNLQGVRWSNAGTEVYIEQLHSRWNPMTLLEGELHLESLRLTGTRVQITPTEPAPDDTAPLQLDALLEPVLPLPVTVRLSNTRFDGMYIQNGDTELTINLLAFSATLQGRQLQIQALEFNTPPAQVRAGVALELRRPYALQAQVDWQLSEAVLDNTPPPSGSLSLGGDLDRLSLNHELQGPATVRSEGEILLELASLLNAEQAVLTPRVDLEHELNNQTIPGMPDYRIQALRLRTEGTIDELGLYGAAQISASVLPELTLDTDLNVRAYLRGSHLHIAEFAAQTGSAQLGVTGDLAWQDGLSLNMDYELSDADPASTLPLIPAAIVLQNLMATGSVQAQQADGQSLQLAVVLNNLDAELNQFPLNATASVTLADGTMELQRLTARSGTNQLQASALLDADQNLTADISIDAPSLTTLYPDLQGHLHATARVSGALNEPLIDIDLLASDLAYDVYEIPQLAITGQNRAGMNELELLTGNITLEVAGEKHTIEQLLLRLRGQPEAHNMLLVLDSTLAQLRVNADGAVQGDGWQGRLLSSELQSDFGHWIQLQSSNISLQAEQMTFADTCWSMHETRVCGSATLLQGDELTAMLRLEQFPLTAFNREQNEIAFQRDTGLSFPASDGADTAPLRLPFPVPDDLALLGYVQATADISGPVSDWQQMNIDVQASSTGSLLVRGEALPADTDPESVTDALPEPVVNQFSWPTLTFSARQENGGWLANSTLRFFQEDPDLPAAMRGSADADLRMDANQVLSGDLEIAFDDLGWLEAMLPQISMVSGELAGRLSLAGTLQDPKFGGDIMLSEAGFMVPVLGLDLRGMEVTISADSAEQVVATGYVESGGGSLNFSSEVNNILNEQRSFSLRLAGSDFMIANRDDLKAAISPDLRLAGSLQGIEVGGQLYIPMVDITVNTLPETAVDVSADTVIINQPVDRAPVRNAAVADASPFGDIPVSGDIRVTLGDNVRLAGFGLSTRVRGELDITQRPRATPLTYGELEVAEGSFEIYGRTLVIEQGKLLFMGSYDNPALDIRAVRQVDNMRVGVQMNGTARNIRSNLFSTPSLSDGDILAVMITGRPISEIGSQQDGNALIGAATSLGINQSQGVINQIQNQLGLDTFAINSSGDVNDSSLMLGKYITPRIFVRYAVGLFETESSLAIDYTVNDRVKLQATSGSSQSIDLTYTVEQ